MSRCIAKLVYQFRTALGDPGAGLCLDVEGFEDPCRLLGPGIVKDGLTTEGDPVVLRGWLRIDSIAMPSPR